MHSQPTKQQYVLTAQEIYSQDREMKFRLTLFIIFTLLVAANCYREAPNAPKKGRLHVISLSEEHLEMMYYKSAKEAIHVISKVQDHGEAVRI